MSRSDRVLPAAPLKTIDAYIAAGGGRGLTAARAVEPTVVIGELIASGLRGRGGAGFPTGIKWRTVFEDASDVLATTIVVNLAEGEPGTFKDRAIVLANPYAVIEGALIAAHVLGGRTITIATKARFVDQVQRLRSAIAEVIATGWAGDVEIDVFEGPAEYLFGEETGLLEAIDGRPPFPRIAPPYRRGSVEVVKSDGDVTSGSGLAADVEMAGAGSDTEAPPALAGNVETMANVPGIIANGAAWFREIGSEKSPGSIVCTVSGDVKHAGVGEVAMGTPLREAIDWIGGGVIRGETMLGVLMGVSNAFLPASALDTPLTYEAMAAAGSGLGSASFIVVNERTSPVALAAGAARFLAVESCGQCTPCKQDGLSLAERFGALRAGTAHQNTLTEIDALLDTVAIGARCALGRQQETVARGFLALFRDQFVERAHPGLQPIEPRLVAELVDIEEGVALVDNAFARKRRDWTFADESTDASDPSAVDDGALPNAVVRLTDHRAGRSLGDR